MAIQDNNSLDQLVRNVNMFANNFHISTLKQYNVFIVGIAYHILSKKSYRYKLFRRQTNIFQNNFFNERNFHQAFFAFCEIQ